MKTGLEMWAERINAAKSSGMKITKWCELNGITESRYYYWHRKACVSGLIPGAQNDPQCTDNGQVCGQPSQDFVELDIPQGFTEERNYLFKSQVMIQCGKSQVFVGDDFSPQTLAHVLEVIM